METPRSHIVVQGLRQSEGTAEVRLDFLGRAASALPVVGNGGGSAILYAEVPAAISRRLSAREVVETLAAEVSKELSVSSRTPISYDGESPGVEVAFNGPFPLARIERPVWGRFRVQLIDGHLVFTMMGANISSYEDDPKVIEWLDSFQVEYLDEEEE